MRVEEREFSGRRLVRVEAPRLVVVVDREHEPVRAGVVPGDEARHREAFVGCRRGHPPGGRLRFALRRFTLRRRGLRVVRLGVGAVPREVQPGRLARLGVDDGEPGFALFIADLGAHLGVLGVAGLRDPEGDVRAPPPIVEAAAGRGDGHPGAGGVGDQPLRVLALREVQRLSLSRLPQFPPLLRAFLANLPHADVLEQLALLCLEEGLVPFRLGVLGGLGTADRGELADLAVVDVEREQVVPAAEEDRRPVSREDGVRLAGFGVRQPPRRGALPFDEVQVPGGGCDAPAAIGRDVPRCEDRPQGDLIFVAHALGGAAGRRHAIQGGRVVPFAASRQPAEVDPLPVIRPAHAGGRLPDVLGAAHDRLEGEREVVPPRRDGFEPGEVLRLERRRGGGDPRCDRGGGGAPEHRGSLQWAPPPLPEGRYRPGMGRSVRSPAQ